MDSKLIIFVVLTIVSLFATTSVLATPVYVSELHKGDILEVDEFGNKSVYATGLGRPGALKFDRETNLLVFDHSDYRVLKVTTTGTVSTFADISFNVTDLTVSDDGKVFLLDSGSHIVWELPESGPPILLAETPDARGFTFGPGGNLYLANPQSIVQVTRTGNVSTFFDPALPSTFFPRCEIQL